jgi:hypothetical protein
MVLNGQKVRPVYIYPNSVQRDQLATAMDQVAPVVGLHQSELCRRSTAAALRLLPRERAYRHRSDATPVAIALPTRRVIHL